MNKELKKKLKKIWHFIWDEDSVWSWIVNVILAFVIIKFLVYPVLGFALSTSHPIVAVVSESMEHKTSEICDGADCYHVICGKAFEKSYSFNLDKYWMICGDWYMDNTNISKDSFSNFRFKNGFNKGDIMILRGASSEDILAGDTLIFWSYKADPIIHRVVDKWSSDETNYFKTKGDHNSDSFVQLGETSIPEDKVVGKAILRIPYLGYVKIIFVELVQFFVRLVR